MKDSVIYSDDDPTLCCLAISTVYGCVFRKKKFNLPLRFIEKTTLLYIIGKKKHHALASKIFAYNGPNACYCIFHTIFQHFTLFAIE